MALLSEGDRYGLFRTGLLRRIPGIGDNRPLVIPQQQWIQRINEGNLKCSIPLSTDPTLELTVIVDTCLSLFGPEWNKTRADIAQGVGDALFHNGAFSESQWNIKRSAIGPNVLSKGVQGVLREGMPIHLNGNTSTILELWEQGENSGLKRHQQGQDLAITASAVLAAGGARVLQLVNTPPVIETIANPQAAIAPVVGGVLGALAGGAVGITVDVLGKKEISKLVQLAIPIATAVLGMAIGKGMAESSVSEIAEMLSVTHVPLNEQWWTAVLAGVGAGALIGIPRMIRHNQSYQAIKEQITTHADWRSMMALYVDSLRYMQLVNEKEKQESSLDNGKSKAAKKIVRNLLTQNPPLSVALRDFNPMQLDTVSALQRLASGNLKQLAGQVFLTETLSAYWGVASRNKSGGPTTTTEGLVPLPGDFFATLDEKGLSLAQGSFELVKLLGLKGDPVSALSIICPTLAHIMIAQGADENPGVINDQEFFGFAGLNIAGRGASVPLIRRGLSEARAFPDSKRARLMEQISGLGAIYKKASKIGGLDRIYRPPVYLAMGQLYGAAYLQARGTSLSTGGQAGELGSKGFVGTVAENVLNAMKVHPLIGYLALVDLGNAYDYADILLVNVSQHVRSDIKNGLRGALTEIAEQIVRTHIPSSPDSLRRFFSDPDMADKLYQAVTMLAEVCGADVIQPILAKRGQALSPIFQLTDMNAAESQQIIQDERAMPNAAQVAGIIGDKSVLYTPSLMDYYWNSIRHPDSIVHKQMAEFIQRGVTPLLAREYLERLKPGGGKVNGENIYSCITAAFKTLHKDDLLPLIDTLISIVSTATDIAPGDLSSVSGGSRVSDGIVNKTDVEFKRAMTLLNSAGSILNTRKSDLAQIFSPSQPEGKQTYGDKLTEVIRALAKKMGIATTPHIIGGRQ